MVKVAIVEDNKTTREGLKTIIDLSQDYRCVCVCQTAEEALELIPKHRPDVVLMDIQLPKMSGVECVARIKELLPQTQVIMVTVYQDPDRIFRALRAGASGYLLKRATPEMVLNAIRDVRQGGVPMSSEIARKVITRPPSWRNTSRLRRSRWCTSSQGLRPGCSPRSSDTGRSGCTRLWTT